MKDCRYPKVALAGWAATLGSVVVYDTWAIRARRPTMSATLGHYLAHPVLGPVLAGAWSALTYHLLVEELLPNFLSERTSRPPVRVLPAAVVRPQHPQPAERPPEWLPYDPGSGSRQFGESR